MYYGGFLEVKLFIDNPSYSHTVSAPCFIPKDPMAGRPDARTEVGSDGGAMGDTGTAQRRPTEGARRARSNLSALVAASLQYHWPTLASCEKARVYTHPEVRRPLPRSRATTGNLTACEVPIRISEINTRKLSALLVGLVGTRDSQIHNQATPEPDIDSHIPVKLTTLC